MHMLPYLICKHVCLKINSPAELSVHVTLCIPFFQPAITAVRCWSGMPSPHSVPPASSLWLLPGTVSGLPWPVC